MRIRVASRAFSVLAFGAICTVAASQDKPATTLDVPFQAKCDGSTQHYIIVLPEGFSENEPRDMLIALHGHDSDRHQMPENPRDECRAVRDVAMRHGMLLVSPDYRAKTSWMGPKAEADLFQIIEELKARYRIARTFLCGGSMGGSSALTFTAIHPDLIHGVASLNGTANHLEYEGFQDAIAESFGGTKPEIPEEYKKRSAEYWPERFTMPVGITTGGKDESVPPGSAIRLARVLDSMGRQVLLVHREDTGHSTNYDDATQVLDFVIEKASDRRTP